MRTKMLMLGLDSIDWALISAWASEGRLPVLGQLMRECGTLFFGECNRSLPGSVWTDIATGTSAAHHGYIHEEQVAMSSYRQRHMDASNVTVAPFYKALSDSGVRCAVVDFPVDYPLNDFNGLQVVDWGTEFKLWRFETRPSSFASHLVSTYGKHPLTNYGSTRIGLADLVSLKEKLLRGITIKQRFLVDLLQRCEHDFIFFNFAELHKAGHFFWRFHDRAHPAYTDSEPRLLHALRETYEAIDRAVGIVLDHLDPGSDLIVVTDRGMYADHRGDHLVDAILVKLGLAVVRGNSATVSSRQEQRLHLPGGKRARALYRTVGDLLPHRLREALLPYHRAALGASPPLDWKATRVFRLPSVGNSYLRINLAERDAEGCVAPGDEYDRLLAEIATHFRALKNLETDQQAVEDVYFPARDFIGPRSAELPDVAIVWNSSAAINAIASSDLGTISGRATARRSGNHRPEGFALVRGPSFRADFGQWHGNPRDLAPTILQTFGVAAPALLEQQAFGWRFRGA